MSKLEDLKRELDEVEDEIESLKERQWQIEDEIEEYKFCEEYEPAVLAALNRNYNKWCSKDYLQKNIRWEDIDLDPNDKDRIEKVLVTCDMLVEKGTIQRKPVGPDFRHERTYEYRITDTETIDMFNNTETFK